MAGWIHRDQTDYSSVLINDGGGDLGQRRYDGPGEMRMDSSGTSNSRISRTLYWTILSYLDGFLSLKTKACVLFISWFLIPNCRHCIW